MIGSPLRRTGNSTGRRCLIPCGFGPNWMLPLWSPPVNSRQELAATWRSVLQLDAIGIDDNFFELGGDSLSATLIVTECEHLDVPPTIRDIFEGQTLRAVLDRIRDRTFEPGYGHQGEYRPFSLMEALVGREGVDDLLSVRESAIDAFPLTPTQLGMLVQTRINPTAYMDQVVIDISGGLDRRALESATQMLCDAHPSLRSRIALIGNSWCQVVEAVGGCPITEIDMARTSDMDSRRDVIETDRRHPLDVSAGPTMRMTLVQTGNESHQLIWTYHHMFVDGASYVRLADELFRCYAATAVGMTVDLAEEATFARFAAWIGSDEVVASERAFWSEALGQDIPQTNSFAGLPSSGTSPLVHARKSLESALVSDLDELCRDQRFTLAALVHAAWALVLGKHEGNLDVLLGTALSGRPGRLRGADQIVGSLITVAPLRVRVDSSSTPAEFTRSVQAQLLDLAEHSYSSLAQVQEYTEHRFVPHSLLSLVVIDNFPVGSGIPATYGPLRLDAIETHEDTGFAMTLEVEIRDGITLACGYRSGVVDGAWVEGLLRHLEAVLGEMAAAPDSRLGDVEMLTATERELVVDVWNETAVDYPEVGLMDRFDAAAMRDPHAVAVVCGDRTVTYGELQSAANRMARWLRQSGVGPDVLVGVCLGRSVELVVSVLAVLKAGGAYVPLDPSAPPARLGFMVTDAAMPVVVTDSASAEGLEVPPGTRVLRVDHDRDELAVLPDEGIECGAGPEHLAYVIYTSGSTGTPKGVLVPRGAVCNLFDACGELFDGFGADDVWALFIPPRSTYRCGRCSGRFYTVAGW